MLKKRLSALVAVAFALNAVAADVENVWPAVEKIPHFSKRQIAVMGNPLAVEGYQTRYMPTLEWWEAPAQSNRTGACAILLSGGAYKILGDKGLVQVWGRQLTAMGVQCVTLIYRTGRPDNLPIYQSAWEDGQRAVRLVRAAAAKRGFDPDKIGVFGMSAGSHLATLLATSSLTPAYKKVDALDEKPCNINWACTCAIAYGMTDGLEHSNSRMGILDATLDPLFKFDKRTCPMWMSHGGADPFSPNTSVEVYKRLRAMKIPAELDLYPDQGHGAHGLEHAYQFLRQLGLLGKLPEEAPHDRSFLLDNWRKSVERVELWSGVTMPEAAPEQGFRPYLEWHMPVLRGWQKEVLVICLAGSNAVDEVSGYDPSPLRRRLNRECLPVVTVHFRDKDAKGALPLLAARQDVRRALKIVRSEAEKRGFNPDQVGVMGVGLAADVALFAASTSKNMLYRCPKPDAVESFPAAANWAFIVSPSQCFKDLAFDFATGSMALVHGDREGAAVETSLAQWERMRRQGLQSQFSSIVGCGEGFYLKGAPGTYRYDWTRGLYEFMSNYRSQRERAARAAKK